MKRNSTRWLYGMLASCLAILLIATIIIKMDISARASRTPAGEVAIPENLGGFRHLRIGGTWEVEVRQSDEFDLSLDYDPKNANRLLVEQKGSTLILSDRYRGFKVQFFSIGVGKPSKASITMPNLAMLSVSGASEVTVHGFDESRWDVKVSGASEWTAKDSKVGQLHLNMSGSSEADLQDSNVGQLYLNMSGSSEALLYDATEIKDAKVNMSGASDVRLHMAGGRLTGSLSGASELSYSGEIAEQDIQNTGVSKISKTAVYQD